MIEEKNEPKSLIVETDDLFWASAAANVYRSARGKGREMGYTLGFKTNDPLVRLLAENLYGGFNEEILKPKIESTVKYPLSEDDIKKYSDLHYKRVVLDTIDLYGVRLDKDFADLITEVRYIVENHLLFEFGFYGAAGYWFPKIPGNSMFKVAYSGDNKQIAVDIAQGLCPDEEPIDIETIPVRDRVSSIPKLSLLVLPMSHPLLIVARSIYGGYDKLSEIPLTVMVIEGTKPTDEQLHKMMHWQGCKIVTRDKQQCEVLGKEWRLRKEYGFDYVRYLKETFQKGN